MVESDEAAGNTSTMNGTVTACQFYIASPSFTIYCTQVKPLQKELGLSHKTAIHYHNTFIDYDLQVFHSYCFPLLGQFCIKDKFLVS